MSRTLVLKPPEGFLPLNKIRRTGKGLCVLCVSVWERGNGYSGLYVYVVIEVSFVIFLLIDQLWLVERFVEF